VPQVALAKGISCLSIHPTNAPSPTEPHLQLSRKHREDAPPAPTLAYPQYVGASALTPDSIKRCGVLVTQVESRK
jgi:hypothetical protein